MIYLDQAATTLPKPPAVAAAVLAALNSCGNASRGIHETALATSDLLYDLRLKIARLVRCPRADHVIFTNNATESLNIALNGLFQSGDQVIASDLEHNSVLRPLYRLQAEQGLLLDFVPADKFGQLRPEDYAARIRPETRAIVCTHASNVTGNSLDLAALGNLCRERNLLLIVDAAQSAGVLPLDMAAQNIDVLCLTGHKGLYGPQGTGALCLRPGLELRPFKVGGSGVQSQNREQPSAYPTRLEAGTLNSHGLAGLSAALDFIFEIGLEALHEQELRLARLFYDEAQSLPSLHFYGDFSDWSRRTAVLAFNLGELDSAFVADYLAREAAVCCRPGAHCAPRLHDALGTSTQGAVRVSFSYFNRESDVEICLQALRQLVQDLA